MLSQTTFGLLLGNLSGTYIWLSVNIHGEFALSGNSPEKGHIRTLGNSEYTYITEY